IVCEDGDSAAISLLGTQSLEDLRGAIGMLLQPALDDWLVRIELALSPGAEVLAVGLLARQLCYRLVMEVQLTTDLGKAYTTPRVIELDLTIKRVRDPG